MPSKEVVTFWLDMGAPISLLSRVVRNCLPRLAGVGWIVNDATAHWRFAD